MIRTIKDIDPASYMVLDSDYRELKKAVRGADANHSFIIGKKSTKDHFQVLGLIKEREVKSENITDTFNRTEGTGRWVLTIDGEYFMEYKKQLFRQRTLEEVKWGVTTLVALAALFVSIA